MARVKPITYYFNSITVYSPKPSSTNEFIRFINAMNKMLIIQTIFGSPDI